MRIVSGKYKSRRIEVPKNFKARPTTDIAKEGLFNILANYFDFEGLRVLDLFTGTGSIGFEFASRGAEAVDMVDVNSRQIEFIKNAAKNLGADAIKTYSTDVRRFLEHINQPYDIVFADPPYELSWLAEIPNFALSKNLLNPEGWFILEHPKEFDFTKHQRFVQVRNYSKVHFSIFK
jgi:16S rRNA (guanine(966)-N(2))-methyltransferase RsmD